MIRFALSVTACALSSVAGALEPLAPYACFAEFEQHTDFENNPGLLQQQRSACVGAIENDPGPKARNFATKVILSSGGNFMIEERTDRYRLHESSIAPRRSERRDGAKGPTLMQHSTDPRSSAVVVLGAEEYFGYRCQHFRLNDPGRALGYRSEYCELPMPPPASCPASRVLESLTMHELAPDGRVMAEKRTTYFKTGAVGTVFNSSRISAP